MKYLVVLLAKDAGADVNDVALIHFKFVEATTPNEALANWKVETDEEKANPDSWYAMAMDVPFITNAITTNGKWVGNEWITEKAGNVSMNLSDVNTYDFIIVELDTIESGKEYSFLVTVPKNANYDISY